MKGIDISSYWKNVDWQKVKNDEIEFCMVKATQGHSVNNSNLYLFTDSMFQSHLEGASAKKINCGVYHYLTAKTIEEARIEAGYFINVIKPYKKLITLWAAVDVEEDKFLPTNRTLLTQIVKTFCEEVRQAGFQPMIYTNPNYIRYRLNNISTYPLWLALYKTTLEAPTAYPNMMIWQYGYSQVDGINEKIDSNLGYFNMSQAYSQKVQEEINKSWAKEDIEWALNNKILLGDNNGNLNLKDPVTREQMCAFLHRLYNLLNK